MAEGKKNRDQSAGMLSGTEGVKEVVSGVHILPGQGNSLLIDLGDALALVDAGPGGGVTAKMIASMREISDKPLKAICYSHGHAGYNSGISQFQAHAEERGDPQPRLIAHKNLKRRYDRYRATNGLQHKLNQSQFPGAPIPLNPILPDPTDLYSERFVIGGSQRHIELLWAPSETDDVLAVWIPDVRVLYGSAATPGTSIPNIGTPLRTQRPAIRWAETLELFASLEADHMVQEFGPVVTGRETVRGQLMVTAEALRWLHEEVRVRMNKGMNATEIIHDIEAPDRLFKHPWMGEVYGAIDYIIRDLYREENGWWSDRNPTSLHPLLPEDAAAVIASAIEDKQAVVDKARTLADEGKTQEALHVIDILAMAPGDEPEVAEARTLKAQLCRSRAKEIRPYVSKALLESAAQRYENGKIGWIEE